MITITKGATPARLISVGSVALPTRMQMEIDLIYRPSTQTLSDNRCSIPSKELWHHQFLF